MQGEFRILKLNCKGIDVLFLQWILNNYFNSVLVLDGDFGKKTQTAVRNMQRKLKVLVDGEVGEKTLNALFKHIGYG